ncbi:DUF262 domain-containing protein [Undibacterium sp. CY18W]|uniref:DUF262 domain-containing protein n=1 Tax=Undibacterium hunanense TaxID=2762292 RepID=A0ABR6ZQ98_9BURK|nr:DUF262 domain-containing protein [Undibacterium hunanense]MBC3918057.1 DUF262 domain-containing protein [Undibacterium hunanense]
MSDSLTSLASENLNPSLRSLLEDVQRGHIRVPRFQRPFVWKDQQRLQLLESIRDNMPIGSLLVWSTAQFELASFPTIGPHIIPELNETLTLRGRQYLLDGHQRVSTLLGVLLAPLSSSTVVGEEEEDSIDWDIQYDLMDQDFVFVNRPKKITESRPLLPLSTLFDGRMVNRHMRGMRELGKQKNWNESDFEIWEERADQLSYRFQQYRIPIVVMVTDDLDLAARTFQRINSQGTPMGEAHLVAALTWTSKFDLRERLASLRENFPLGWRDLDDHIFLQVCKGLITPDISKIDETELIQNIREDNDLLNRAAAGLNAAINLLINRMGVVRQDLLPYAPQLVFLSVEYARRGDAAIPEHAFVHWFWRTGCVEVFGSGSFRQVRTEQEKLRNISFLSELEYWDENLVLRNRFDSRFARIRVWMLRMAARKDLVDENGISVDGKALLASYGKEAFTKLFTTPAGASTNLRALLQTLGNRVFIDASKLKAMRNSLRENSDIPQSFLDSHLITHKALSALRAGNLEGFIQARNVTIAEWDKADWKDERRAMNQAKIDFS